MADILLTTFNARYRHTAFGLRWLMANLGELRERCALLEFDLARRPVDAVEAVLAHNPTVVGVGVYVWNAALSLQFVTLLKKVRPEAIVVLGGPEVSHEIDQQEIGRLADYVVPGEGEWTFRDLCAALLNGELPKEKVRPVHPPDLTSLALPYDLYDADDIAHRVIYVEASRGCPFKCSFCLSALDKNTRAFPLEPFLAAIASLLERGARQFKFVDRTFNLKSETAAAILDFFLQRLVPGLFLHFELIPDRLPEALKERIKRFPPGALQFEIGVQSFDPEVQALIDRKQDNDATAVNLRWLMAETHAHLHTDLIIGLPGEGIAGFAAGFDRLARLAPHEIQVGILKRLRGAPIDGQTEAFGMLYSPEAPYELLKNDVIDFNDMQRLKRFARYWDLIGNSGRFSATMSWLFAERGGGKPFTSFLALSDWIFQETGQTHKIALKRLFDLLGQGIPQALGKDPTEPLCQDRARFEGRGFQRDKAPARQARRLKDGVP